ncbi:MAG: sugar nucleotide-binding protein [Ignavibacteria bacterium]
MKILITGVSGYIAPYLCKALLVNSSNNIYGVYNSNPPVIDGVDLVQCDLGNNDNLEKIFEDVKPDIVYHLASVTPTRITTEADVYIEYFNSKVTGNIAKLCAAGGSLMIYTSTDLVYKAGIDLKEDSSPLEPLTIYAKTKQLGENSVKEFAKKYLILRTSLVYGFTLSSYTSFFDVVYKTLKENKEIRAFTNQFRNAIYTEDAADILVKLPMLYKQNDIINFCGSEYLSRYEMCIAMCEAFGFDKKLVIPASTDEFTKYPMVKELGLNTDKLSAYGSKTDSFKNNLHKSLKYTP